MGKFSQYKQSFREEWKTDPMFQNWIESVKEDNLKAYCKHCHIFIPAHYAGLTNHASSPKHCKSITKNEKKLLRQSLSFSDSPKKRDGLSKQRTRKPAKHHAESSDETPEEHNVGLCTLELTVDDMTCQSEKVRVVQQANLEACKKIAPEPAPKHKDSAALRFELADVELPTTSEDRGLARNGKPMTPVCADWLLNQSLQGSNKDAVFCKQEQRRNSNDQCCNVDTVCEENKIATCDSLIQDVSEVTPSVSSDGLSQETESEATLKLEKLSSQKDTENQKDDSEQRYLSCWSSDPILRDWVAPVPGNMFLAQCRWCRDELRALYKDLRLHLGSVKHAAKALKFNVEVKTEVSAQVSSVLDKESAKQANINSAQHHRVLPRLRDNIVHPMKRTGSSFYNPEAMKRKVFVQTIREEDTVSCMQESAAGNDEKPGVVSSNNEACQLDACVIPVQAVQTVASSVDTTQWLSKSDTSAFGIDDSPARKQKETEEDDSMQMKRYPQKYVLRWNSDPVLRDWVAPVTGNVYRARCRWCRVELRAHYKDLKHHAGSTKHATSAMMRDGDYEMKDSAEESSFTDEESFQHEARKRMKTSVSAAEQKTNKNPCYFLSRSSWDRYKQKYRKAWESDPSFNGWIAPVEGDIFKARCLYCRVLIRAHHKDLKEHSKTTKHATNVGYGLPYNNSRLHDANAILPRPKMLKRRVIGRRKRKQVFTRRPYAVDIGQEDNLLKPDDTLASIESLVNLANMSGLSHPESTVTTLVFPNATQLDESVAAALPNNPRTMYRVKKLSSAIGNIPTKKSKMSEEDGDVQDQMTRLVKKVTLWEFLKMKVERSNAGLRIPKMLSEFETLYDQIRQVTKERLEPVNFEDTSERQELKPDAIMVLSSDRLAKLLDMSVGHYRIKEPGPLPADSKGFSLNRITDKASATGSADGSTLFSVQTVEHCIPADGLQSGIYSTDHVGQREEVMTTSELVFPTADHIIQLQETDCLTPNADDSTQVFSNADGTFLIHVSGPQRQIPLDVIQYLFAAKEEDARRLHGTTGDSTALLP